MTSVKMNFKSQYQDLMCDLCENDLNQTDFHLLDCETVLNECSELSNDNVSEYEDIFGNISKQHQITKGSLQKKKRLNLGIVPKLPETHPP